MKKIQNVLAVLMLNILCCASVFGADIPDNEIHYTLSSGRTELTINQGAFGTTFESNVFEGGQGRITFKGDVTVIGYEAFKERTYLKTIEIPNKVNAIGEYAFYYCQNLTSINIPEGVTGIGKFAFAKCLKLSNITLPSSLTSIGDWAFNSCRCFDTINIPANVISIGQEAFLDCSSLTDVIVNWDDLSSVSIGSNIFRNCDVSKITLHVPEDAVELYKSNDTWKIFKEIVEKKEPHCQTTSSHIRPLQR